MTTTTPVYGKQSRSWIFWGLGSLALVIILSILLIPAQIDRGIRPITVYCAAGIRMPIEEAAKRYEEAYQVPIRLDYGSSGSMEVRMRMDVESRLGLGDVFIPADNSFSQRTARDGITRESILLAGFHLVLACHPDLSLSVSNMNELLAAKVKLCICDTSAAAGKKTQQALTASGHWDQLLSQRPTSSATVVEAGHWIKESKVVQAGFIWNTTAQQLGLKIIELPELAAVQAAITANLSAGSKNVSRALHFMRYLQSPEHGAPIFRKHHFDTVDGDRWAETPELTFFSGGLNREAVADLVKQFEMREGVRIHTTYAGCGTLVATMKSKIQHDEKVGMPDAYLTCDASYMTKVQSSFGQAVDLSSTEIVILVQKGNPKNIRTISDLAREDVRAATTNPQFSTLGNLSWQILGELGIDEVKGRALKIVQSAPTAHELIAQMQNEKVLDCALVYLANCNNLKDKYDIVPIHHPLAKTIQNIAAYKESPYPYLTERFINYILAFEHKAQFEDKGFNWLIKAAADE